ncbi:hypothetical protein AB9K36_02410 [Klebsiella michiganensis]
MIKKPLIAGIMLVVAHTATALRRVMIPICSRFIPRRAFRGYAGAGMLAVPEEGQDEVVPQNVRHLLVRINCYFDETRTPACGLPAQTIATGVT